MVVSRCGDGVRPVQAVRSRQNTQMGLIVKITRTGKAAALAADVVRTSRRGLMCGALGAGAAAVLAACGSSNEPSRGSDNDTDSGEASDGERSQAIALVADIPVGGGMVVDGLVLVQPEEGTITAFEGTCPHQGSRLPVPEDGVITCPAHSSQFNATDGSLIQGPATTGLTEVPVTVEDGQVFRA